MNAQQKDILRRSILEQLAAVSPCGLPQNTMKIGLQTAGFNLSDDELQKELVWGIGKGFMRQKGGELSRANIFYYITAAGFEAID